MINKRLDIIEEQIKEIKEFIKDNDYFKMLENGLNITNEKNDKLHKENIKYKEILDKIKNYLEKQVRIYGGGGLAQEQLENFNKLLEEIE